MLGKLYLKRAAVQASQSGIRMPSISAAASEAREPAGAWVGGWGGDRQPMGPMGRFDASRPEWTAAMQSQPSQRVAIPSWASHRDMFGNFYVQESDGTYSRAAVDPTTGTLKKYPVQTTTEGLRIPGSTFKDDSGQTREFGGRTVRQGVPSVLVRGRGETRESMGTGLVSPEEALGLTDVAKAYRAGSRFVDQRGEFFQAEKANMRPMDEVNPEMAKNYRMNGMEPPMVDASRHTTAQRWAADPANAQAVAVKAQRAARLKNPEYQARVNESYAKQGVPMSERPAWLREPTSPEAFAKAKADAEALAAAVPAPAPVTTAAVTGTQPHVADAARYQGALGGQAAPTTDIAARAPSLVGGGTPPPASTPVTTAATGAATGGSTPVTTASITPPKPSTKPKVIGVDA